MRRLEHAKVFHNLDQKLTAMERRQLMNIHGRHAALSALGGIIGGFAGATIVFYIIKSAKWVLIFSGGGVFGAVVGFSASLLTSKLITKFQWSNTHSFSADAMLSITESWGSGSHLTTYEYFKHTLEDPGLKMKNPNEINWDKQPSFPKNLTLNWLMEKGVEKDVKN